MVFESRLKREEVTDMTSNSVCSRDRGEQAEIQGRLLSKWSQEQDSVLTVQYRII